MRTESGQLLARLGSGVRPGGVAEPPDGPSFSAMLDAARRGELRTGQPVAMDGAAGVELSSVEAERLSVATDRAAAAGVREALVLIGGHSLRVDTAGRRVLAAEPLSEGALIEGVDAVVSADAEVATNEQSPLGGLLSRIPNALVLRLRQPG